MVSLIDSTMEFSAFVAASLLYFQLLVAFGLATHMLQGKAIDKDHDVSSQLDEIVKMQTRFQIETHEIKRMLSILAQAQDILAPSYSSNELTGRYGLECHCIDPCSCN